MTPEQRIALFRPHIVLARMTRWEQEFTTEGRRIANWEYELIASQLATGTKPEHLILPAKPVADLAKALASSLIGAYGQSASAARFEIAEARNLQAGKPASFTKIPAEGAEFYPEAGLDWYRSYALRIVGAEQIDVLERAKRVIDESVRDGLNNRDLMTNLRGVFADFSKRRLENIARTEVAKIYEQGRIQEFEAEEEVVGYEVSAILDPRTTAICRARHGKRFPKAQLEGNAPPYHYQCRTTLLPIFSWEIEDGSVKWKPVPRTAVPVLPGFGTKSMVIPERGGKAVDKLARRAWKAM